MTADRWRRDARPMEVCSCSHSYVLHNTDRKTLPCQTGGCTCTAYDHAWNDWREHRTIREAAS